MNERRAIDNLVDVVAPRLLPEIWREGGNPLVHSAGAGFYGAWALSMTLDDADRCNSVRERLRGRFRNRTGRCYELSFKIAMRFSDVVLVHGEGNGLTARVGHAWLEVDGIVYDPAHDEAWTEDQFTSLFGVVTHARYSRVEAARTALQHNHSGPWTEHCVKHSQ